MPILQSDFCGTGYFLCPEWVFLAKSKFRTVCHLCGSTCQEQVSPCITLIHFCLLVPRANLAKSKFRLGCQKWICVRHLLGLMHPNPAWFDYKNLTAAAHFCKCAAGIFWTKNSSVTTGSATGGHGFLYPNCMRHEKESNENYLKGRDCWWRSSIITK